MSVGLDFVSATPRLCGRSSTSTLPASFATLTASARSSFGADIRIQPFPVVPYASALGAPPIVGPRGPTHPRPSVLSPPPRQQPPPPPTPPEGSHNTPPDRHPATAG